MDIIDMSVNYLGVSLGSSNIYIYKRGKGIVLSEPTVIAVKAHGGDVVAVGTKAKNMIGRAPDTIVVSSPVKYGVISDFKQTVTVIRNYVERSKRSRWGMVTIVSVPVHATTVERRAVKDAVYAAYGKTPYLIPDPLAAAIGCGLNPFDKKGFMIADIGGGSTEISVIVNGGAEYCVSLQACAGSMDRDIVGYIRKTHGLLIGEQTAEKLKIAAGNVFDLGAVDLISVSGRDILQGLPETAVVSADDIREAVEPSAKAITDGVISLIEKLPPELTADIIKGKIYLCGGGALIRGWVERLYSATGITAQVVDNPTECVAEGAGGSAHMLKKLKGTE